MHSYTFFSQISIFDTLCKGLLAATVTTVIAAMVTSRIGVVVATGRMQSRHVWGSVATGKFKPKFMKKAKQILVYINNIVIIYPSYEQSSYGWYGCKGEVTTNIRLVWLPYQMRYKYGKFI